MGAKLKSVDDAKFSAGFPALDSPSLSVRRTFDRRLRNLCAASSERPFSMPFFLRLPGFAASLLALGFLSAGPAAAQGVIKETHADWQIRCDTPPGAKAEQCALVQSVTAEDRPNVGLSIIVLKLADNKSRLLRVLAPLGVLLPAGLGLRIDDAEIGRAGFVRCLPDGCVAEVVMDENLLTKMRTGKNAVFIIFQTPEEGIGIPVSLNGFGPGFDKLP